MENLRARLKLSKCNPFAPFFSLPKTTIKIKCRFCESDNVTTKGKTESGKQRFRCKECNRRFVLDPEKGGRRSTNKPKKPRKKTKKPKKETEKPEISQKPVKPRKINVNLDNVKDVPCFFCLALCCEWTFCEKFHNWLERSTKND